MTVKTLHLCLLLLITVITAGGLQAQDENPAREAFRFSGLTVENFSTGTRQYLVYRINTGNGKAEDLSLWNRTTEITDKGGEQFVEITQNWRSLDENRIRKLRSVNRLADFSPVTHHVADGADGTVSAYVFNPNNIEGDPDVASNSRVGFSMTSRPATLNWELDMETFPMLPMKLGKSFNLHFYHPGSRQEPQLYTYTVTAEDTLHDQLGRPIETWVLHIRYGDQGTGDFWVSKNSGSVIKTEEKFGNFVRYKVLLGVPTGLSEN